MKRYEYIRLEIDMGSLTELNKFSRDGWRVVALVAQEGTYMHWALLEREIPA